MLLVICISSWRNAYSSFLPICNALFSCCFCLGLGLGLVLGVFILDINPFFRYIICKYFLPFHRLCFHSIGCFLCYIEVFKFYVVSIVYFYFCGLCFWYHIQEIIAKPNTMKIFLFISSRNFIALGHTFRS